MRFACGAVIGLVLLLAGNGAQARTWKNRDGKTIEAEVVSRTDRTVTLELKNGRTSTVEIETLSLDDRAYLASWKPEAPKRPLGVPEDAVFHRGSWYRIVLDEGDWNAARQKAEKMGGHLAVIKDAETNEMIVKLADGLLLWLGATDEEVDGLWKWVDGDKLTFKAWGTGEPNGGRRENYLRLGIRGKWIDVNERGGANRPVGFIVQWKG